MKNGTWSPYACPAVNSAVQEIRLPSGAALEPAAGDGATRPAASTAAAVARMSRERAANPPIRGSPCAASLAPRPWGVSKEGSGPMNSM